MKHYRRGNPESGVVLILAGVAIGLVLLVISLAFIVVQGVR